MKLYNKENIHDLKWPDAYAKAYLEPLIINGVENYISNIKTDMHVLVFDNLALPVTVNEAEYDNSYTCSPFTHYITYAIEELKELKNRFLQGLFKSFLIPLGSLLRLCKINKTVVVNNWLLSTNLYPEITEQQIHAITAFLQAQFPQHAITFRSVNQKLSCFTAFPNLLLSRQIYLLNTESPIPFKANPFKRDLKLLRETNYRLTDPKDHARVIDLYNDLYIKKYSQCNPQFTKAMIDLGVFTLKGFEKDGMLDAVLGYFERNGVITAPIFGYDASLPIETGLYRLLSTQVTLEAKQKNTLLHMSSGAAQFKRLRKAESHLEYTAYFIDHLPWHRRLPWMILKRITDMIAKPLMKNLQL